MLLSDTGKGSNTNGKKAVSSFEELHALVLAARRKYEKSEAEFFLLLLDIERDRRYMRMITKEGGYVDFDAFLRGSHGGGPGGPRELCKVSRFRAFEKGATKLTRSEIVEYGVSGVVGLGMTRPEHSEKFKTAIAAWKDRHDGLTPRGDAGPRIARDLNGDPPPKQRNPEQKEVKVLEAELKKVKSQNTRLKDRVSKDVSKRVDEIERLKAKNVKLEQENRRLKRENLALKKRVAELEVTQG